MLQRSAHWESALHFTERCGALERADEVADALEEAVHPLGYEFFAITRIPPFDREPFQNVVVAKRWPSGWYERYVTGRFYAVDPVARKTRRSKHPFWWSASVSEAEHDGRALSIMMNAASDFRMREGVCVPLHGLHGLEGAVSLGGEHVDTSAGAFAFLHLVSVFAGTQIARLASETETRQLILSAREREVMRWAAVGKTAAETASTMNIAVSTVDKQIASAMRKLGSGTKAQAVAQAISRQEITV